MTRPLVSLVDGFFSSDLVTTEAAMVSFHCLADFLGFLQLPFTTDVELPVIKKFFEKLTATSYLNIRRLGAYVLIHLLQGKSLGLKCVPNFW